MDIKYFDSILLKMETHNPKLYEHSEKTAMLCYATAKHLNLPNEIREMTYFAGLLHDLGRFYINFIDPDLDKEIKTKLMPYVNGALLFDKGEFGNIIPILLNYKKEYNDSSLSEEQIILVNIIMSIADDYDFSRRKNISHQDTCKLLREKYVKHNNLVTAFLTTTIGNGLNLDY